MAPRRFEDVRWNDWVPAETATLLFVVRGGQILLIHKKRGLGAGKINGPGGRIDPDETPLAGARREVREELGVTPTGVRASGELSFQFTDGYSVLVHVFTASGCRGEPVETAEAAPLWTPLDRIPYERMWADDRIWLPLMLAGRSFRGRFLFEGDRLLGYELDAAPPAARPAAPRAGVPGSPAAPIRAAGPPARPRGGGS